MIKKSWHTNKGFINREGNITFRGLRISPIRRILNRIFSNPYQINKDLPKDHIMSKIKTDKLIKKYKDVPSITRLGHATFLIKIDDICLITDPLLFGNPGPSIIKGLKRIPCYLDKKNIKPNVVFISHEHEDHLHHPSLDSLPGKDKIQPIVPLGIGKKIKNHGFKEAIELDWFEEYNISNNLNLSLVPAAHYGNFRNSNLRGGFVLSYKKRNNTIKIYFSGDTDYGKFIKKDIGSYGPFDIVIVGIGGFYLKNSHAPELVHTTPEEAIQIAKDLNSKKLIGMHRGTLKMGDENPNELFKRMEVESAKIQYKGEIKKLNIGETTNLI